MDVRYREPGSSSTATTATEKSVDGIIRPYQDELSWLYKAVDALLVGGILALVTKLAESHWRDGYTLAVVTAVILFYASAQYFRVYGTWRSAPLGREVANILLAWIPVSAGLVGLAFVTGETEDHARPEVAVWLVATPWALIAWRASTRVVLRTLRRHGRNTRNAAIVGAGSIGKEVAEVIVDSQWMGLKLLGFYDARRFDPDRIAPELPAPLCGDLDDLVALARSGAVDVIYVALPLTPCDRVREVIDRFVDTTASVYIVPDTFLVNFFKGQWVQLGPMPVVSVYETPFYGAAGWVKRAEDIVIASTALLFLGLPMLLIALGIKLSSPGPAVFRQRRYGLDGREFPIWKFRTMVVCEDGAQVPQATREDRRVTRLGAFLRRNSLDELPQFINVLQGHMSVVGPRPHASAHNEQYRRLIPGYMLRHKVKPGITGWAQTNGWRGMTDTPDKMEKRVEHDLWYIRNWSITLDLKIIALTLIRGFTSRNAY